jgi:hypothetical protein
MAQIKRSNRQRDLSPPDAAAIDIGATMHVAAVSPYRDPEPVRTFGTVTGELHRLADHRHDSSLLGLSARDGRDTSKRKACNNRSGPSRPLRVADP